MLGLVWFRRIPKIQEQEKDNLGQENMCKTEDRKTQNFVNLGVWFTKILKHRNPNKHGQIKVKQQKKV